MKRPAVSSFRLLLPIVILGAPPAFATSETRDEIDELRLLLKIQQEQIEALQEAVRSQQVTLEAQHELLTAVRESPAAPGPSEPPAVSEQPAALAQADERTKPPEITPEIVHKTVTDEPDSVVKASTALTATADYGQEGDEPAAETGETTESEASEAVVEASTALTGSTVPTDDRDPGADDAPERTGATEDDVSFAGSWPLPDTNARLRIGGYVKLAIVDNFDPLLTDDRFIVGGIPSDETRAALNGAEEDVTLSVSQSRLNLELRDASPVGDLRAFVEGDFASANDTFRLRHAFGQFRRMLAGKTWSTLMDLKSRPEEVDFEGINGRINVRQAQLRFFPKISEQLDMSVSFEDPSPDVSGGTGISQLPDIVVGVDSFGWPSLLDRLNRRPGWHARLALLLRNISARNGALGKKESTTGWGITASGSVATPYWSEDDQFLWQLTYGDGVGRYINDLGTIGGQDAIFSPSGNLQTWPVFAGYVSYQHWWQPRWRSNLTFSWVKLDTYGFQSSASYVDEFGDPYERTLRGSINLLYNPIPRVELGAEFLWGERKNANDTRGDATQLQLSAKYGF